MRGSRILSATVALAMAAVLGIGVALAAGTGTVDPPPRVAFVANAYNPADALAVGPTAGRLGAPVFTTPGDTLSDAASDGLVAFDPDLVIVAGGGVAVSDAVLNQIAAAVGLPVVTDGSRPAEGIIRVAGTERTATAAAIADLIGDYDPAFLPVDATATDADLLDGMDSTDFLATDDPVDADTLDGAEGSSFASRADALTWLASDRSTDLLDLDDTDPDTTVLSASVDLPDECGDGSTTHRVIVDLTLGYAAGPGNASNQYGGRAFITVDGEIDIQGGAVGIHKPTGADLDPALGVRNSHGVLELAPGAHEIALVDQAAQRDADDPLLRYAQRWMTLTHAGWTCA